MEKSNERVCRVSRILFPFLRVRKWLTAIGRRTIFPFFVIRIRFVMDLFIGLKPH
jgi:hypothetical protein